MPRFLRSASVLLELLGEQLHRFAVKMFEFLWLVIEATLMLSLCAVFLCMFHSLLGTSASLLVTSALLVVTRNY